MNQFMASEAARLGNHHGPAVPKAAALVLADLAHDLASWVMPADEIERKKSPFYSLAEEMKNSPEMLEAFRWERSYQTTQETAFDFLNELLWKNNKG